MATAMEDFAQSDVDPEMTVLTSEDITEQNLDVTDEVETLQNRCSLCCRLKFHLNEICFAILFLFFYHRRKFLII